MQLGAVGIDVQLKSVEMTFNFLYTPELLSSIPGKHWHPPATSLDTAEVAS